MGAITTFSNLNSGLMNSCRSDTYAIGGANVTVNAALGFTSSYGFSGGPTPTSAVALDNSVLGSLAYIPLTSTKQFWLAELEFMAGNATSNIRFCGALYDRLCHSGGLVGNVTTEQTTNLPTATLPRYTDGEGVMAFVEVYTTLGTSTGLITIKYTNQAGVANRQSQPVISNANPLSITPIPLQDGDTGILSVQSLTMSVASTSAGNIGITLMKKLAVLPVDTGSYIERQGYRQMVFHGGIVEIKAGAYIQMTFMPNTSLSGALSLQGRIGIVES
jgi:hypothetical protein